MNHQYKKKPVIIEAFRLTEKTFDDNANWPNWLHESWNKSVSANGSLFLAQSYYLGTLPRENSFRINTPEGTMIVTPGDWIIRGVEGELYACKHDIFMQTYEKV